MGIWLNLNDTPLDDAAMVHLAKLRNVRRLFLSGTKVTDAGLRHLHGLPMLVEIDLIGTAVSDEGVSAFQSATPTLQNVNTKPEEE